MNSFKRLFVFARASLLFTVLVSGMFVGGCSPKVEASEDTLTVRVMSFNIRYGTAPDGPNHWNKRRDLVMGVIRDHAPDFLGVQEALRFQLDEILDRFPLYAEIGVGRDGGKDGEYSAILYRKDRFEPVQADTFWMSDTPGTPSAHWGNHYLRTCTWGLFNDVDSGAQLYVYNSHLDHESQAAREKSTKLISRKVKNRAGVAPYIVMGDFNAGEANPAITYLTGEAENRDVRFLDSFRVQHPDAVQVGTFNGFKGELNGDKIDYILVSQDINVVDASIVRSMQGGRSPSDHFPVIATLELPVIR